MRRRICIALEMFQARRSLRHADDVLHMWSVFAIEDEEEL